MKFNGIILLLVILAVCGGQNLLALDFANKNVEKTVSGMADAWREVPDGVRPGMRYRDYRDLYSAGDYAHMSGDPYIPALSGVCSFFIPGLGQMISGEVGRGFAWLGGIVGCGALVVTGSVVAAFGMSYSTAGQPATGMPIALTGTILSIAGSIGILAVDVASIVDAVKVSKIKNMYTRDIRDMSSADITFCPYVTSAVPFSGKGIAPAVGLSLNVRF